MAEQDISNIIIHRPEIESSPTTKTSENVDVDARNNFDRNLDDSIVNGDNDDPILSPAHLARGSFNVRLKLTFMVLTYP